VAPSTPYSLLTTTQREVWSFLLKAKDETESWVNQMECKHPEYPIIQIHFNRGGEYIKETLGDWLREKGIQHTFTTSYTPEHNRTTKKKNQNLIASTRSMLTHSSLLLYFLGEGFSLLCLYF
jgi:transposase InsO family protein